MMWRFGLLIAGLCGSIVSAADAHQQHGGGRLLQDCSSISRRKQCRKTTGCQWNGRRLGCGPIPTSPPSALPTPSPTPQPTPLPTDDPTQQPTSKPTIATPQPTFGQGDNLILNAGFEAGLANWYANSGSMSILMDTTQYHSGAQSVLATGRTSTWNGPEQNMFGRMSAGKTYLVSCWAKLKGATSSDNLKLTLRIDDDVGGRKWRGVTRTINNQDWTLVQGEIAVSVTGTLTDIRLYAEGAAIGVEYYVDDVSVTEVVPTAEPTEAPTPNPTSAAPTAEPTNVPTSPPTSVPTSPPSSQPTSNPTPQPTEQPTSVPTPVPTSPPSSKPTSSPTAHPSSQPTSNPTPQPTPLPTDDPTQQPTSKPTIATPQPTFGQGDNLVLNAGFEAGLTNWYANSGAMSILMDTTQYHSGAQSVLATGRTSTWNGPEQNMFGRMSAGKTYLVSCWAKLKGATSSDNLKLTLRIDDDVGGRKWRGVTRTINNQDWTLVQGEIEVSVTGTLTDISLYAEGPAIGVEYYVDDVSVTEVVPTAEPTEAPTPLPTPLPTNNPISPGMGYCSDGSAECVTVDDCACSVEIFERSRLLQEACACLGLPTSSPSSGPTPKPTSSAPTKSPSNAPTPQPSDAPTSPPSNPPTSPPTPAPTDISYGNGPFVTSGSSSELVTIPRPPNPGPQSKTNCPHLQAGLIDWHDPATWPSSSIPAAGESVTLPENSKVIITQAVLEELGVITVPTSSELIFGEDAGGAAITLDAAGMDVQGALRAGSETCVYDSELIITLHGSRPTDLDIYGKSPTATPTYKGISVNGGIISMHGKRHFPTWSRLAESVPIGQNYLLLQEQVDWEAGQDVLLTTTAVHDSRDWHRNEVLTIDFVVNNPIPGVVGSAVHFTSSATYAHIANSGYQAEVGLLSRNIKIQGAADDSEPTDPDAGGCTGNWHFGVNFKPCPWTHTTGFGGHIMVHSGGKGYMEGVQLFRMGQTNVLGRYPFHWHQLGNDCSDCYFRANSIHRSFYRCISIHGTHNTTVSENVAYGIEGFCYYLEDGVEEDNTISFNLAAHIHPVSNVVADSGGGQTITPFVQSKDLILPADATASGFYITNLHNDIIGNAASGGWAGFALPILHSPIGPNRNVNMRPGNRLTKVFDGNVAHSTGWWWSHAGAFYSGGSLYYNAGDDTLLEYNAGRDQSMGTRSPCLVDKCVENNDCGAYCYEGQRAWYRLTNNKVFMTASPSLNSWSGRTEVIRFEAHDVALGMEALEDGFGIDQLLVECRSGEEWVIPGGRPDYVSGNGFFWYDTGQGHIITNSSFRNCGARNANNAYDTSPTRGCDTNTFNGCSSGSTVWGFLTHSDQFTPELMQATSGITYEDCGRRFKLADFADDNSPSSVSGRAQNWIDKDGSASGLNESTIIASGLVDAGHWWKVDSNVVDDTEAPLVFIKKNAFGNERGLGHIRLRWKDEIHNTVGNGSPNACTPSDNWQNCGTCYNGPKVDGSGNPFCPALGRIRHIGSKFDLSNDPTGGLPITANAEVAGLTGGFAWLLQLDDGPPKSLKIDQIEVDPIETPMILAIPYDSGTSFSITAHASQWCSGQCTETFVAVDSVDHVRASQGNTYHYDAATKLLYVRIIQTPQTYLDDWHLWNLDDLNEGGGPRTHALDRFTFSGITLPSYAYGPYLQIDTDCAEGAISGHCASTPSYVEPEVCPSGYVQVSYDKCCVSEGSSDCYDPTVPPTSAPTSQPTFGQGDNLVLNPGFESGKINWYPNYGPESLLQIDTSQFHSGAQSILVTGRTSTWNAVEQDMRGRMVGNKTYRVSCWAKLKGTTSSDNLKLTVRIDDDVGGRKWRGVTRTINNQDWTLVEGDILVDVAGTLTDIRLFAEGPAAGVEFYVDDVSAIEVTRRRSLLRTGSRS